MPLLSRSVRGGILDGTNSIIPARHIICYLHFHSFCSLTLLLFFSFSRMHKRNKFLPFEYPLIYFDFHIGILMGMSAAGRPGLLQTAAAAASDIIWQKTLFRLYTSEDLPARSIAYISLSIQWFLLRNQIRARTHFSPRMSVYGRPDWTAQFEVWDIAVCKRAINDFGDRLNWACSEYHAVWLVLPDYWAAGLRKSFFKLSQNQCLFLSSKILASF